MRGWGKSSTTISYIIISSGDNNREKNQNKQKQKIGAIVLYLTFHYNKRKTGNSTLHSNGDGKRTFFKNGEKNRKKRTQSNTV